MRQSIRPCAALVVVAVAVIVAAASYTNDCGSSIRGYPCEWNNGITGYCDGNGLCDECSEESYCEGPSDCNGCTELQEFSYAFMCIVENVGGQCTYNSVVGTCTSTGACQNSVANDPVIQGFDGKIRNYDEVGDFNLLKDASGRKIDITFKSALVEVGEEEPQEKSWTSAVRFISPNGDAVSCSLPGVQPNTSTVTVTATPAGDVDEATVLTATRTSLKMEEMSATALLSWKEYAGVQYSVVVGCEVITPTYTVTVYQVSGWEEAVAKPEEHGWAAPYTWLNLGLSVTSRLEAPVTGILGDTYPKDLPPQATQGASLELEAAGRSAGAVGLEGEDLEFKPAPPATRRGRSLFQAPDTDGVFTAHLGMGGSLW